MTREFDKEEQNIISYYKDNLIAGDDIVERSKTIHMHTSVRGKSRTEDIRMHQKEIDKIMQDVDLVDEERRMCILLYAINNGWGLTDTRHLLASMKYRDIYVRNLYEYLLHYCLSMNEKKCEKVYRAEEFYVLYNRCKKILKNEFRQRQARYNFSTANPSIEDMQRFVNENRGLNKRLNQMRTMNVTSRVWNALQQIETSNDTPDDIVKYVQENAAYFVDASEILRYYFIKYVLYIVKAQLKEFKEILLDFTMLTRREVLNKYGERAHPLSLKGRLARDIIHEDEYASEGKGKLLDHLKDQLIVYGKIKDCSFIEEFGQLKNKTSILKNSSADRQTNLSREIEKMTFTNFRKARLSPSRLYSLIYTSVQEPRSEVEEAMAKKFMEEVVGGERDLSRDSFMYFLLMADQILKVCDVYKTHDTSDLIGCEFPEEDELTEDRFKEIVSRCHFAPVGKMKCDGLYLQYIKFDAPRFKHMFFYEGEFGDESPKDKQEKTDELGLSYEITYIKDKTLRNMRGLKEQKALE